MKKLLSLIALTLFTSTQALASVPYDMTTTYVEPEYNFEIQIANSENSISNLLNGYIDILTTMATSEFNEKELTISNIFLEEIEGKNMQINVQNSGYWFQVEQSSTDFEEMLAEIEAITFLKEESTDFATSYEFRFGETAFANIAGKLVISDSNNTIFMHDEEISAEDITLENNQILSVNGELDGDILDFNLTEVNGVISSFSKTNKPQLITESEFNTNEHLYQDLKANNPAFYVEFSQALNLILSSYPEDFQTELKEELDYEFSESLPSYENLFNKQTAILVDLNDTIIPELTLAVADVNSTEANQMMTIINEELPTELASTSFNIEFTNINSDLRKITITPTPENVEADLLNIDEIVITYGLHEGNFIITNNPTALSSSNTLADNSSFSNSFAASKSNIGAVSFIDFEAIANQISVYENEISRIDENFSSEVPSTLKSILSEMGIWSNYSYIQNDELIGEGELKIPSELLLEQLEVLVSEDESLFNSYTYNPYTDVESDAWYYDDVSQAYELYIIDTFDYETETFSYDFQPGKDITRGEFVEMIVAAYELEYEDISNYGSDIFSDVDPSSYFDYSIGVAYEKGIIKGDDAADTFRPNDTLNRAEAVQILYNASPLLSGKESTNHNFTDVPAGAWYENVVSVAVQEAIVEGINPQEFAPGKNLNKAEAVTLLIRLVNNEVRF